MTASYTIYHPQLGWARPLTQRSSVERFHQPSQDLAAYPSIASVNR